MQKIIEVNFVDFREESRRQEVTSRQDSWSGRLRRLSGLTFPLFTPSARGSQ
jgi:hypothetical protein